jgi:hypothetical protein
MNIHDPDPIATRLEANGYQPFLISSEVSSDSGSIRREFAVQGFRPILDTDGAMRDWVQAANLSTVTLTYSDATMDKFSKIAGRFADAIIEILAPTGALVRRTPTELQITFRDDSRLWARLDATEHPYGQLFEHGLRARDAKSRYEPSLQLVASNPDLPISADDPSWGNRSPLNTPRAELPEWDGPAVSAALERLVDDWARRGDLKVCERYLEPARPSNDEPAYLGPSIDVDPSDWDPASPARKTPGLADRVRALREKLMGSPSKLIDNDQLRARLEEQRPAPRASGTHYLEES